jgi:dipeptidyl aminopeptidase/acylaminoacyl peptidase
MPVELVIYPREGHGVQEREHMRDLFERMMRCFERYL